MSAHLVHATVVKHFFHNALALSVRFLEVLKGPLGAHGVDLGAIWGAFGSHFGDFLGIGLLSENVCFSILKPYFLGFGRVLDRVFFVLCFWINTFGILFVVF